MAADTRALELARNQSAFRDANEHLEHRAKSHHFEGKYRFPFRCECGDPHCHQTVMLSIDEYEHIRTHPSWFLLLAGHQDQDASHQRIIDTERGYATVETIGTAGAEAARLNPRHGRAT